MNEFLFKWWDVAAFLLLAAIHTGAWLEQKYLGKLNRAGEGATARQSGAQMMTASSASGIAAVSILVPASMLIVQLSSKTTSFPLVAVWHVFRGALWFPGSLFLGLWVIFLAPLKSQSIDARASVEIGIPFGLQLIALFFGMVQLVLGLHQFLLAKGY